MATKNLIKKMTNSRDVKPKVMKASSAEVQVVEVPVDSTVEDAVAHEMTKTDTPEKWVTVEFMNRELQALKNEIQQTHRQLMTMQGKVEVTFGIVNDISNKIEEAKAQEPKSWKRLFKKCQ
jgi:hypothetical protein